MNPVALNCAVSGMFRMLSPEHEGQQQSPTGPLEMLPERRVIICLDTKNWTIAIGWIKLGFGICSIIWYFSKLIIQQDAKASFHKMQHLQQAPAQEDSPTHLGIRIVVNVAFAGMGILLLFGACKENPSILLAWLVFNGIAGLVLVINAILEFEDANATANASYDMDFGSVLGEIFFLVAIEAFFTWVVYIYREEMSELEEMPFGFAQPPRYYSFTQHYMPTAQDFGGFWYYPQRYEYSNSYNNYYNY